MFNYKFNESSILISWNDDFENDDIQNLTYDFLYELKQEIVSDSNLLTNSICIDLSDSSILIALLKKHKLNEYNSNLIKELENIFTSSNGLKKYIEDTKFSSYSNLLNDDDFLKFKENVIKNLDVSVDGEFGDVTRKQLVKTYSMSKLNGYMNFSEPGSGKTIMTLMSLVNKVKDDEVVIIVSPKNSMNVWYDEVKKFLKWKNKNIHFYSSDMHKKFSDNKNLHLTDIDYANFILINYEYASNLTQHRTNMRVLKEFKGGFHLVFDEAHRIKNGSSVRNAISKSLSREAKSIITLTGTPFSKEISEMNEMMSITFPREIPFISKSKLEEYTREINLNFMKDIKTIDDIDFSTKNSLDEFTTMIKPLYFALKKKNDFNIPDAIDKYDDPIMVEPLPVQIDLDKYISQKVEEIKVSIYSAKDPYKKKELIEILGNYYTAGLQASINPSLLNSYGNENYQEILNNYSETKFIDLPKIKSSLKFVKDKTSKGEKVIVWFNFVDNIKKFKLLLLENGINAVEIYGDTPAEERKEIIDSFSKKESGIQVLVTNPATLAESISLHKSVHTSLFVERTFSYFRWAQAKDRIHRVGSPDGVEHNYVRTKRLKMEANLFENLLKKKIVSDKLLSHPDEMYSYITNSRIVNLEESEGIEGIDFIE